MQECKDSAGNMGDKREAGLRGGLLSMIRRGDSMSKTQSCRILQGDGKERMFLWESTPLKLCAEYTVLVLIRMIPWLSGRRTAAAAAGRRQAGHPDTVSSNCVEMYATAW